MKILNIDIRTFTYESDVLEFFLNQNEYGFLDTTSKKTKRNDYIYHVYLLWYDQENGEAHRIPTGRIRTDKKFTPADDPDFKNELEMIMTQAEQTRLPFEIILDQIFT